jgi:hypothetical protein
VEELPRHAQHPLHYPRRDAMVRDLYTSMSVGQASCGSFVG